jgi:hypothetical protein
VLFLQARLTGLTEGDVFLDLHVAVGAVTFSAFGVPVNLFVCFIRAANASHPVLVVLDRQMKRIRSQVGAVQLVLGKPFKGLRHILVGDGLGLGKVFPLAISVSILETAMAEPQPNVWNFMSSMRSSSILR